MLTTNNTIRDKMLTNCRHQLNTSSSKFQYSFSKDNRFNYTKRKIYDLFYDLPSTRETRTTSFGFGNKSDLATCRSNSPSPDNYKLKTQFDVNKLHKRGFSFGYGREEVAFGSLASPRLEQIPGPQKYLLNSTLSKQSYSIRKKFNVNLPLTKTPGPGYYPNILQINRDCKYPISNYRTSGQRYISPLIIKPQKNKKQELPGPGTYNQINSISPKGQYPISIWPNSQARSFSIGFNNCKRPAKSFTPGPGYYPVYSEFG